MTAEQVFHLYRAYKFYYAGKIRFEHGRAVISHPPLIKQRDRQFYYRIAQKMGDAQIHALFIAGFFYRPHAYVSDFMTPEANRAALIFAGRQENGRVLMEHDLYELHKRLPDIDLQEWLYGIVDGKQTAMPGCIQDVIAGELPADLAAMLLLIPQRHLSYDWPAYWAALPDTGLGCHSWIDRLKTLDQLLRVHRTSWRSMTHELAEKFWNDLGQPLTPIKPHIAATLF